MNLTWFFLTILILLILWSTHRSISTLFIFLRFLLYRKYHLYWGWEPASVRLSYQNINWVGKAGLLTGWTEGSADRPFRTYTYIFFKFDNSSKDAGKAPSVWSRFENFLRSWECKDQGTYVFQSQISMEWPIRPLLNYCHTQIFLRLVIWGFSYEIRYLVLNIQVWELWRHSYFELDPSIRQ